mgnify:CR=1 FL=1|jgi:amino acid transporter
METRQIHRFAMALLMFFGVVGAAVAAAAAWVFGMIAWIALVALLLSAILVAGTVKLHDAWLEARWNSGRRLR